MKQRFILLLLLSLLIAATSQFCEGDKNNDLIITGTASFSYSYQSSRQRCYEIPSDAITRRDNVQAIAVPSSIEGYNSNGLDFSVQIGQSNRGLSMVLMIGNENNWRKIEISYLITARDDMWIGTFVSSTFPLIGCWRNDNRNAILKSSIPSLADSRVFNTKAIAFLSGVRTENKNFNIDIKQIIVNERQGLLEIQVSTNAAVEFIQLSFIIYDINSIVEAKVYSSSSLGDFTSRAYSFSGLKSCSGSSLYLNYIGFGSKQLKCEGSNCPNSCVSSDTCKRIKGNTVNNVCYACRSDEVVYGEKCAKSCTSKDEYYNGKQCVCYSGFIKVRGKCVVKKNCRDNEQLNDNNECECLSSYEKDVFGRCKQKIYCKQNEERNFRGDCVCISGYSRNINGKCVIKRTCGSFQQLDRDGQCVCISGYSKNYQGYCTRGKKCDKNQYLNSKNQCVCQSGYTRNRFDRCEETVRCNLPNQLLSGNTCVCEPGYQRSVFSKYCEKKYDPNRPNCPSRSSWNQNKLKCQCTYGGQYLIDNECKTCGSNEGWNGQQCVCSTGYFKIAGVCRTCDINTFYDGKDCICNLGFYGNRDSCAKCHQSCGKCSGPHQRDCITCSDVSYIYKNGYCKKSKGCPPGLYQQAATDKCEPCSSYCAECSTQNHCAKCIPGFKQVFVGSEITYCAEICGDGKRFEDQCDDGNTKDGDGCNSKCEQQKGWQCSMGSTTRASTCIKMASQQAIITPKGAVHLFGKVVQGVRLNYIPEKLQESDCAQCHKILLVKVVKSSVVPGVKVSMLPKSRFQFFIQLDFSSLFAIPVFQITVQLNPEFSKYFEDDDMAQLVQIKIDPATLARPSDNTQLSFDDIPPLDIFD